jgi:alkylated DNA repair dioxygenase AlkB
MRARQTASFGVPYNYSGQTYEPCPIPPAIAAIAARATELVAHPFTNCLCNRYDRGTNAMGFHRDSYEGLTPGSQIAIASFAATRSIVFRSNDSQHVVRLALEHGSLLLMAQETQAHWTHGVPAEPGAGLRISATFRWIVQP